MQDKQLIQSLIPCIPPTSVRDYAKSRGWEDVPGSTRRIWIFRHHDAGLHQLVIPKDRDEAYNEALLEVLIRLEDQEKRPIGNIASDLLTVNADVARFRVTGEEILGGMLPVDEATGLLDGVKRALLASACSVINPVTHHPRLSRAEADDFLRVCRMGQTEIGSFVVKIICPMDAMNEQLSLQREHPFAREVTTRLLQGCHRIVNSIEQDTVDQMLEENASTPDVTSNLCDALLRMHATQEKGDLTVDISWAANPRISIPTIQKFVNFKPEYFRIVDEIHRQLRPQKEETEDGMLCGTVETLNGNVGADGRRSGEVIFALLLPGEDVTRARANLEADEYEIAVKAHEQGRGYVSFKGILKRGVRVGRVESVSEFKLLGAPENGADAASR